MPNIGIDIGTSYSSVCILDGNGQPERVKIDTGASMFGSTYSLPSAVFAEKDGRLLLGQAAMGSRMRLPENFKSEFKRDLGQLAPYQLGGMQFLPEDLYKEFFIYLKKCVEDYTNESVTEATITCPAVFNHNKKELIQSAAKKAGLLNSVLLDEPSAAAYCYLNAGKLREGDTLLVYDLGGGTFDVALLCHKNGAFEQLAQPQGLANCGGADFDKLIFDHILEQVGEERLEPVRANPAFFRKFATQIMETSIKAKHHLSSTDVFSDVIPVGYDAVDYMLTRNAYNVMIAPIVDETIQQVRSILKSAGIGPKDVSNVLLVGGASRTPLVRERLAREMGKEPLKDIDPELAVCAGAAIGKVIKASPVAQREEKEKQLKRLATVLSNVIKKRMAQKVTASLNTLVKKDGSGQKESEYSQDSLQYGNTSGNIANGGSFAFSDDWIYFTKKYSYEIYKMRMDGSNRTKLNDIQSFYINVVDGWIYYSERYRKICKIRIDGSEQRELLQGDNHNLNVVDGWIYYSDGTDGYRIHRMRTDGRDSQKLSEDEIQNFNHFIVSGGWIYYPNRADHDRIYRIRTDGSNRTKLNDDDHCDQINVVDGWVFYDKSGIYKMRTDGSEKTKLCSDVASRINVADGWIYYLNHDADYRIYRIRTDGRDRMRLNDHHCSSSDGVNVAGGLIFYSNSYETGIFKKKSHFDAYRMKLDGTCNQPGW